MLVKRTMHKLIFRFTFCLKSVSFSLFIILFSHSEKDTISQTYFSLNKMHFHSHKSAFSKTHILLLSNYELSFILAFQILVNINTSGHFQKHLLSYREHLRMAPNITQQFLKSLQFFCKRKLVLGNQCFRESSSYLEWICLFNKLLHYSAQNNPQNVTQIWKYYFRQTFPNYNYT